MRQSCHSTCITKTKIHHDDDDDNDDNDGDDDDGDDGDRDEFEYDGDIQDGSPSHICSTSVPNSTMAKTVVKQW